MPSCFKTLEMGFIMRATFFGLEIGRTGLSHAQYGLDVTGHNLANLDTDGYTRQRIVSTAYDPFATIGRFAPVEQALVGGGVRVQILDQIRSAYLDRRFRTETTGNAYWDMRAQSLTYIESYFDNVNEQTSINYSLAEFFRAMTIVAQDPVSGAPRTLLQTSAMDLVQQLNNIYEGLIDFQKVENRAVETKTKDINRIADDIAELNKAIYGFEITGMIANDLRDKRNLLIDELARYIDVEYEEYPDKFGHTMMKVTIAGNILVDHDRTNRLGIGYVNNVLDGEEPVGMPYWLNRMEHTIGMREPKAEDYFNQSDFETDMDAFNAMVSAALQADVTAQPKMILLDMNRISGGELKAHIDMRDEMVGGVDSTKRGLPYYIEMVNNLARALVQEINAQHSQGWTNHPEGSETGINFFYEDNAFVTWIGAAPGDVLTWDPDQNGWVNSGGILFTDPAAFGYVRAFDVSQVTARNLRLSDEVIASAFNIAASSVQIQRAGVGDPEDLQQGNNVNMLALNRLFQATGIVINVGGIMKEIGSFDDYCTTIRFDVGSTLNTAKLAAETSRILTLAAENQRTAIAGVSLDEEMVHLVKFNHAYNGAARVITQMDDALDRLINGTGRVGL